MFSVPAHIDKFAVRAHKREADQFVPYLEDGVPADMRVHACDLVRRVAEGIASRGTDVLVRVSADLWQTGRRPGADLADVLALVGIERSDLALHLVELLEEAHRRLGDQALARDL